MYDFVGNAYVTAQNLKYNIIYKGVGTFGSECMAFIDENGIWHDKFIISSECLEYDVGKAEISSGNLILNFSEDGKSFVFNGNTFSIK